MMLFPLDALDLAIVELMVLPKTRGHIRTSISRIVGRHAQMRPMFISIVDHQAVCHKSQVGFAEL
jgi:hypothetical protein